MKVAAGGVGYSRNRQQEITDQPNLPDIVPYPATDGSTPYFLNNSRVVYNNINPISCGPEGSGGKLLLGLAIGIPLAIIIGKAIFAHKLFKGNYKIDYSFSNRS